MSIVTNIASTLAFAPVALSAVSSTYPVDINIQPSIELYYESNQNTRILTTEIAKYYSSIPDEEPFFCQEDLEFLEFVNMVSETQIELDEDLLDSLNRLEEKNRNSVPKKVKF